MIPSWAIHEMPGAANESTATSAKGCHSEGPIKVGVRKKILRAVRAAFEPTTPRRPETKIATVSNELASIPKIDRVCLVDRRCLNLKAPRRVLQRNCVTYVRTICDRDIVTLAQLCMVLPNAGSSGAEPPLPNIAIACRSIRRIAIRRVETTDHVFCTGCVKVTCNR